MRPRFLGSALLASLCVAAASTFAQAAPDDAFRRECERKLEPASISVRVSALSYTVSSARGVRELTAEAQSLTPGMSTLGLTTALRKTRYSYGASRLIRADGLSCLRPRFEVVIDTNPQEVFVAREFAKGTCAYNEILDHELRHVDVNQRSAQEAARAFEAELRRAFGNKVYYGEEVRLAQDFELVVEGSWLPRLRQRLAQTEVLQQRIDTPEEYERISRVCDGEASRVLRALRQAARVEH